ncbi:hypothetical protein Tco_1507305 [Tanacetum coccineum]
MPPLLSLLLSMACDDNDGCVTMGNLAKFATMAVVFAYPIAYLSEPQNIFSAYASSMEVDHDAKSRYYVYKSNIASGMGVEIKMEQQVKAVTGTMLGMLGDFIDYEVCYSATWPELKLLDSSDRLSPDTLVCFQC